MASTTQDMRYRLSLRDLSRWPHHHPNQHSPEEEKLNSDMRRRNPDAGLVVFWVKLRQSGYSRSIPDLYRLLKKQGILAVHPPNPKFISKPYEQMTYPDQRIQVDVKFVPSACLKNSRVIGKQFFQYTAIYEYSKWRSWKLLRNIAPILLRSLWNTWQKRSPSPSNASRRIMKPNLPTALLLTGTSWLSFKSI